MCSPTATVPLFLNGQPQTDAWDRIAFAGHSNANVGPCECLMSHALLVMGSLFSATIKSELRVFLGSSRLSREVEKKWWPHCRGWLVTLSKLLATDHANCCLFTGPPPNDIILRSWAKNWPCPNGTACRARLRTPLNKHLLVERPPARFFFSVSAE